MVTPLIACRDAAFAYDGNTAIRGLNFEVHTGDYLCIAGENGSGKSTLVKGLLRLIAPQQGKVLFAESLKAAEIGYLPQHKGVQKDFPAGVYEVALSGRQSRRGIRPFYSKADKQAAEENLIRLGIGELRNRCYRELSGGQQQRVLLARALCAARKALFLDEPASGLDPLATADLYRLLEGINQETGIAVIMVSHDVKSAVKYAGRILHVHQGEQTFLGTATEYTCSAVGKEFLGAETEELRHD